MTEEMKNKATAIIKRYEKNADKVTRATLCEVCDFCGVEYNAKTTKEALIDFLKNALTISNKVEQKIDKVEEAKETSDKDAPAELLPNFSKRDVTNGNLFELRKMCDVYGIEYEKSDKPATLRGKILSSGKLSHRAPATADGDGVRARNFARMSAFIAALLGYFKSIGVEVVTNKYHGASRIGVKIDDKIRFTLFVQSAHLNIACRPEDAELLGYHKTESTENKADSTAKEYGHLAYQFTAFIKQIDYPETVTRIIKDADGNDKQINLPIDETNIIEVMPAELLGLLTMYGAVEEPEADTVTDNTETTEAPAPEAPAYNATDTDNGNTTDNGKKRHNKRKK